MKHNTLDASLWKKVCGLTADTRRVQKDFLFFLLPRAEKNAEDWFEKAQTGGALEVVHSCLRLKDKGLFVEDVQETYSQSLQDFYRESFANLKIYGLTGTNGKTTTAFMLQNMMESYGEPCGIFGTIKNSFKDNKLETFLTSPTAEDFYAFNHENYKQGMKTVVCEVSSHALDQKRLGLKFLDAGGFTSFSQDHLDYHQDMTSYLKAKKKMVSEAFKPQAVLFANEELKDLLSDLDQTCFLNQEGGLNCKVLNEDAGGLEVLFSKKEKSLKGVLPLLGSYNVQNFALAVSILCFHFGEGFFPDERIFQNFKQIPGRMERISLSKDSEVFVDFSHTPDSLEKSLQSLSQHKKNRKLIVVFGCGGDRDKIKRPLMAKVADAYADHVVVTSDNPRTEDPEQIIKEILKGAPHLDAEVNREKAIHLALDLGAQQPSLVLVAGKGHEAYQEINGLRHKFSDQEVIKNWVLNYEN